MNTIKKYIDGDLTLIEAYRILHPNAKLNKSVLNSLMRIHELFGVYACNFTMSSYTYRNHDVRIINMRTHMKCIITNRSSNDITYLGSLYKSNTPDYILRHGIMRLKILDDREIPTLDKYKERIKEWIDKQYD